MFDSIKLNELVCEHIIKRVHEHIIKLLEFGSWSPIESMTRPNGLIHEKREKSVFVTDLLVFKIKTEFYLYKRHNL